MSHDLFISYSRRNLEEVKAIREELEDRGFSCWMDLEEIPSDETNYKKKIIPAIREARLAFLFVLSAESQESENALKEIGFAGKKAKKRIVFVRFDAAAMSDDFFFDYQNADIIDWWNQEQREKLLKNLRGWRQESRSSAQKSGARLRREGDAGQQRLLAGFGQPATDRVLGNWDGLRVLDLGSSAGDLAMSVWEGTGKLRKYLGIDCDPAAVASGNRRFGKMGNILFAEADLEVPKKLEEAIVRGKQALGIGDFNVVNFGMVLTYLKKPDSVLRQAHRHLVRGGFAVVLDIDEGGSMVAPDREGIFAKTAGIFGRYRKDFGWPKSGRQVFGQLLDAGFTGIRLERTGLSTCGMTTEERKDLFNYRFNPVLDVLKGVVQRCPKDSGAQADLEWCRSRWRNLKRDFMDARFFFNLGLVLFTARRP